MGEEWKETTYMFVLLKKLKEQSHWAVSVGRLVQKRKSFWKEARHTRSSISESRQQRIHLPFSSVQFSLFCLFSFQDAIEEDMYIHRKRWVDPVTDPSHYMP